MAQSTGQNFGSRYVELVARLSLVPSVRRFDDGEYSEASTLAHAFLDLEETCRKFVQDQLPRLMQADPTSEDMNDLLIEIGEEFRQMLYHLRDPRYYRYLESR